MSKEYRTSSKEDVKQIEEVIKKFQVENRTLPNFMRIVDIL